jgi:hypothetical protein
MAKVEPCRKRLRETGLPLLFFIALFLRAAEGVIPNPASMI